MVELTPVGAKGALLRRVGTENTQTFHDVCIEFLREQGFSSRRLHAATEQASRRGTDPATELLATGVLSGDRYYRGLAKAFGVRFCQDHDVTVIVDSTTPNMRAYQTFARLTDNSLVVLVAPRTRDIGRLATLIQHPGLKRRIAICSPNTMRHLLVKQYQDVLVDKVCKELRSNNGEYSSHGGPAFAHGVTLSVMALFLIGSLVAAPSFSASLLHVFVALFFFACVAIRAAAAISYVDAPFAKIEPIDLPNMPIYTVLIALRDEAQIVPSLMQNLRALHWPTSKLQIIFACEVDDLPTIAAIEKETAEPHVELVIVPFQSPLTKPKALTYALNFVKGEILTIYDAEDEPHPLQLIEAYQKFLQSDPSVVCLQAPLVTTNPNRSCISALFHFEYAGLFRALMPWLDRAGAPLLLGGTSNHFRTAAVRAVGGWDPYNVTEDADIGLRLWRKGYRTGMITRPTLEPAPHMAGVWLRQRTRWFKGWLQTTFVHTRHPARLLSELGVKATSITILLLVGTVASAIAHPFLLTSAVISLARLLGSETPSLSAKIIAWIDWSTIIMSYSAFAALCWAGTLPAQRRKIGWRILLIPIYWVGFSIAAWRAVFQLFKDPFLWEKTPH
ncbi:MAG: glycosyltransferase family 2 protein [Pseudomonadota bacterium]